MSAVVTDVAGLACRETVHLTCDAADDEALLVEQHDAAARPGERVLDGLAELPQNLRELTAVGDEIEYSALAKENL